MRRRIASVNAASNNPSMANTKPKAAPKSRISTEPDYFVAGASAGAGVWVGVEK